MKKKDLLRQKAEELLKKNGVKDKSLYEKDLISLVEELSIFQIELEHQNQELLNTQQDLIKSQQRFLDLFNNAPIGYIILNNEYEIQEINLTACNLINLDYREIKNTAFTKYIHPDYQDTFYFYFKSIAENPWVKTCDLQLKRGKNQFFFARLISTPETNYAESKTIRMALIDISYEKEMEKLYADIERVKDNEKLKSAFLTNMSHEIRTPLNGIIGMVDILRETKLQDNQIEYLDVIKNSSQELLNIVNDILDLSKIEAGKMELSNNLVDVDVLANRIKGIFEALKKEKNIQLFLNINEFVPKQFIVDEKRLMQIINNLVSNAIKFTYQGSVTINFLVHKRVMGSNAVKIKVEVIDTGIGIKSEELHKIFQKFSQLETTATRMYDGSGLGLLICRELARMLDGEIYVESEYGKGSKFTFIFTANLAFEKIKEQKKDNVITEIEKSSFLGKKVLLVEDIYVNQKVAMLMLENLGCEVKVASNGLEALNILKDGTEHFDFIFMDIQMPIMDGYTATKKIREFDIATPIIAITAYALEGDNQKALEAGCSDYISKPIDIQKLFTVMKRQLPNA